MKQKSIPTPFFKEFKGMFYEHVRNDGESVLRYRGNDKLNHYIASSLNPDGGKTVQLKEEISAGGNSMLMYESKDGEKRFVVSVNDPNGGIVVPITWLKLKELRDGGRLASGTFYRITDYVTTTTQIDTRSIGKYFDVVVLALSSTELSEDAWAMHSEGRAYDVTFGDGVAKCYLFLQPDGYYTLVDVNTKLGMNNLLSADLVIDEGKKAINAEAYYKTNLNTANLDYVSLKGSNVGAWKLKYCLDNDTNRFAWADNSPCIDVPASIVHDRDGLVYERYSASDTTDSGTQYYAWKNGSTTIFTNTLTPGAMNAETYRISPFPADDGAMITYDIVKSYSPGKSHANGKGVIWRMVDEWGNDCPYDFKNIQFKRWAVTGLSKGSDEMKAALIYDADDNPFYFGIYDSVFDDVVAPRNAEIDDPTNWAWHYTFHGWRKDADGELTPYDKSSEQVTAPDEFKQWSAEEYEEAGTTDICKDNILGHNLDRYVRDNEGSSLYGDAAEELPNNVFMSMSYCFYNEEEEYWEYSFDKTYSNRLGDKCYNNTFGNSFQNNTLGEWCTDNTFGNSCGNNTFGNNCGSNTFGNWCYNNTFGNSCGNNTFGNNFEQSSIGDGVNNITVSKDYVKFIIIENGNQKITITSTATTSSSQYVRNIAIALGTNNSNSGKTISHNTTNDTFKTTYQNSNSTTKNV